MPCCGVNESCESNILGVDECLRKRIQENVLCKEDIGFERKYLGNIFSLIISCTQ